ncbi:MAG: DUF2786 domain-containing protein [Methylobacter sp.]|nr:MAG: DUF2786 domain-containing protein [Methylobacter sp.]
MTEDELKKIADKIAKCLAVAASTSPEEAEIAKRQANALMEKYGLNSNDVAAAGVHEKTSKTGGKFNPPVHLVRLSGLIASAFGCGSVFQSGGGFNDSLNYFIGPGIKPELAAYTFDVLRRQISKDRSAYTATLKRYKRENRIRMADLFCNAWVTRIARQVHEFAGSEQDRTAINAYKQKRWGKALTKDARNSAQPKKDSDWQADVAGAQAASDVSLHKPVQAKHGKAITDRSAL